LSKKLVRSVDDLEVLLKLLPSDTRKHILQLKDYQNLVEVVLDVGRVPEIRFSHEYERLEKLAETTQSQIDEVVHKIGKFNLDNRAGIARTLHRISAIRNRNGKIIGLTCRVGRVVQGTIEIVMDILNTGKNILFLGPPGIGKTTHLREATRVLADDLKKRVIVVDTSNEIAGDGDIPHIAIGSARRMQVATPDEQHHVMIEAVENHTPEVIVVDEIGTEEEAKAARTIAERGVQLIATAHGHSMENLVKNPTLADLLGGIQTVILGDEEAKFRGTQKTVLERKNLPTFHTLIEIRDRDTYAIYKNVAESVDGYLRGELLSPVIRYRDALNGDRESIENEAENEALLATKADQAKVRALTQKIKVYPFGLNTDAITTLIHIMSLPIQIAPTLREADLILTVRSTTGGKNKLSTMTKGQNIPTHVLKENTMEAISDFFRRYFDLPKTSDDTESEAIKEAERACEQVLEEGKTLDLSLNNAFIRRLQHSIIEAHGLNSVSVGEDPNRRVRIYPKAK